MTDQTASTLLALVSQPLVSEQGHPVTRLNLDQELRLLKERLGDPDRAVEVDVAFATTDNLLRLLTPRDYDILHFSGHGNTGVLAFEDGRGAAQPVTERDLQRLVRAAPQPPRLAFLSACHSESLADALTQTGVTHVVAIEAKVGVLDLAATAFARAFYPAVLAGRPLEQAFEIGRTAVRTDSTLRRAGQMLDRPWLAAIEESKFLLLPLDADHSAPLFPSDLPPGELIFHLPNTARHNLSARPATFTGRQRELHHWLGFVLDHRVTTLNGVGGIGKTTLAQEMGRWFAERGHFRDGIFFVDLRELAEISLVRARVAAAADLDLSAASDDQTLAHALAGERLLILDDLDRVAAADPRGLADLLCALNDYAAPTRLLLTTRERVSGPAQKRDTLRRLRNGEAQESFLREANLAHDRLTGDENDLAAILNFLDGWPHAIILAARLLADGGGDLGWLRAQLQSAQEGALADPLIPPDKRRKPDSLSVSLRLSYQRLLDTTPDAAQTFARLALFPGGADAGAVRAILGAEAAAHLPRLRALSLAEDLPGGRLRLLAPARAFAGRLLPVDVRKAHGPAALAYYEKLAAQANEWLAGANYDLGRTALLSELPNIESWLDWGFEREPVENQTSRAARLAGRLRNLYMLLNWPQDGFERLKRAAQAARRAADNEGEANTLKAIGFMYLDEGKGEEGLEAVNAALALYQAIDSKVGISNTLWMLGERIANAGRLAEAEPLLAEAVELSQAFAPGHPVTEWRAGVLAHVRAQLGDEPPLPPPERQNELRASFGSLVLAIAAVAHGDDGPRAEIEGLFERLTEGDWQIVDAIQRIWAGERDAAALTAEIDPNIAFLVREMLAAVTDPQGYAAGLSGDDG